MIDDKNKGQSFGNGIGLRHGGYNRFGESIPDYEDVKDEYSIEEAVFLRNNRLIKENKQNRSKYDDDGRHAICIYSIGIFDPQIYG